MTRIFIETPIFTQQWFSLGFTDDDLLLLQQSLLKNPESGKIMRETGGLRKLRFALKGQGKSGSVRVCYIDFSIYEKIYLILVFAKKERDNLSAAQKQTVKELIKQLKSEAEGDFQRRHKHE